MNSKNYLTVYPTSREELRTVKVVLNTLRVSFVEEKTIYIAKMKEGEEKSSYAALQVEELN